MSTSGMRGRGGWGGTYEADACAQCAGEEEDEWNEEVVEAPLELWSRRSEMRNRGRWKVGGTYVVDTTGI
jgi:hypothetical protein